MGCYLLISKILRKRLIYYILSSNGDKYSVDRFFIFSEIWHISDFVA